ncbi:hypothetical protein PMIN06_010836 [Paraphaeosphaeria minitans]
MNGQNPRTPKRSANHSKSPISQASKNSRHTDSENLWKMKHVAACIKRRIERFVNTSRADIHSDDENMVSLLCFELQQQHFSSYQPQSRPTIRRTHVSLDVWMQDCTQYYMDEGNHPFITTPGWMKEP